EQTQAAERSPPRPCCYLRSHLVTIRSGRCHLLKVFPLLPSGAIGFGFGMLEEGVIVQRIVRGDGYVSDTPPVRRLSRIYSMPIVASVCSQRLFFVYVPDEPRAKYPANKPALLEILGINDAA